MRASEILRSLSDMVARAEQGQTPGGTNRLQAIEVDNTDPSNDEVMVTPLQQKHELLKKAAGVDSFYDDGHGCDECGSDPCECEADPLDTLKQHAGIPVVIQDIGGEENDIA